MIGQSPQAPDSEQAQAPQPDQAPEAAPAPAERLDPTRYGDWEKNGRCIDF